MDNPIHALLKWIKAYPGATGGDYLAGYDCARQEIREMLLPYQQDPHWVCLEGMTVGELQAFDYGCALSMAAVIDVLDGKVKGGTCNEPWASLRKRLEALVERGNG